MKRNIRALMRVLGVMGSVGSAAGQPVRHFDTKADSGLGVTYREPAPEEAPAPPLPASIVEAVAGSIVLIERLDERGAHQSTASGFLIGGNIVVTNLHCIEEASGLKVNLGEKGLRDIGEILVTSEDLDIAMLRINGDPVGPGLEWAERMPGTREPIAIVLRNDAGELSTSPGWTMAPEFDERTGSLVLRVSSPTWMGCSGAPVVDHRGCVVGVISRFGDLLPGQARRSGGAAICTDVRALSTDKPRRFADWVDDPAREALAVGRRYMHYASWCMESQNFTQAREYLRQAQILAPADFQIAHNLSYLKSVEGGDGLAVLREFARDYPDQDVALVYLGHAEARRSGYRAAIELYEQAIKISPRPSTWFWLGTARWWHQDLIGAIQAYEEVLRQEPRHTPSIEGLARLYSSLDRAEDHLRVARMWVAAAPRDPTALQELVWAHRAAGQKEDESRAMESLRELSVYHANRAMLARSKAQPR